MANLLYFANLTFKVNDNQGGTREITKKLYYQVDDTVFTDAGAQVSAVLDAVDSDIAPFVDNTNAANTPRSYMGLVGCEVGRVITESEVAANLTNLSENGYLSGNLPAGQIAAEYRDHVELYEVEKENGIGYMRFTAPEPASIEAAIDIISIQADFVFPILSYPDITNGLELANKFGEIIAAGLKSDYKAS